MQQIGPCNSSFCWSAGVAQTMSVFSAAGSTGSFVEFNEQEDNSGGQRYEVVLNAFIASSGAEVGTLTIIPGGFERLGGNETLSTLSYKSLLDHHVVVPNGGWTGFMAGQLTGGTGFYEGAQGVVTFTARQIDASSDPRCKRFDSADSCYVKFATVQGYHL